MSLGLWLEKWNVFAHDSIALVDGDTGARWTYAELFRASQRRAQWLRDVHKVGQGDRVAWTDKNRPEFFEVLFACARLGAILVPVNWRLAAPEVQWILDNAEAKVIIDSQNLTPIKDQGPLPEVPAAELTDDSPLLILYTSGTTGRPKGAMLTHGSMTWNSVNTSIACDLRAADSTITYTPLFHTGAVNVLSIPLFHRGGKVVLTREFRPEQILQLIEKEDISILFGVPTTFEMLREHPKFSHTDFSTVRFSLCGGAPCPIDLIHQYAEVGVVFRQGYGLTEVGPNCFSLPPEDAVTKAGTVGFPVMHCEARLVNAEGQTVAAHEVGELWLRGPHVCAGYWRNPEATQQASKDGWWATGDLFSRDNDGYFRVVGRKKEMFISGGENVYPAEVEQALHEHPSIKECTVVGIPNQRWGEVGLAYVVTELSQQALEDSLQARLARYKIPKHWIIVEALPRTASGKVDRRKLTELGLARTKSKLPKALSAILLLLLGLLWSSPAHAKPESLLGEASILTSDKAHQSGVQSVSVNGSRVLSADRSGLVVLWNSATKTLITRIQVSKSAVCDTILGEKSAIIACEDGLVKIYQLESSEGATKLKLSRTLEGPKAKFRPQATALALSSDSKKLAVAYSQGSVIEFDIEKGLNNKQWKAVHSRRIVALTYLPKSAKKLGKLATVSWDGSLRGLNGRPKKALHLGLPELTGMLWIEAVQRLVVCSHIGNLFIIDPKAKAGAHSITHNPQGWLAGLAWTGRFIAAAAPNDNAVALFDQKGRLLGLHKVASKDPKEKRIAVTLAANSEIVVTGNTDGSLTVFPLKKGKDS